MRFPHKIKDKFVQSNFDYLSSRFGVSKMSPVRVASAPMPVGLSGFTVDGSGFTTVQGIIVVRTEPSAHYTFTYFPQPSVPNIAFNNSGVAQTLTLHYIVVGI